MKLALILLFSLTSFTTMAKPISRENSNHLSHARSNLQILETQIKLVKMLANEDEKKASCLVLGEAFATDFGLYAQAFQLNVMSFNKLDLDIPAIESRFTCWIDTLKGFCHGSTEQTECAEAQNKSRSSSFEISTPKVLHDLANQAALFETELRIVKRHLK